MHMSTSTLKTHKSGFFAIPGMDIETTFNLNGLTYLHIEDTKEGIICQYIPSSVFSLTTESPELRPRYHQA